MNYLKGVRRTFSKFNSAGKIEEKVVISEKTIKNGKIQT